MLTPSEISTSSAKVERRKYAHVCVELDLQKKLVPRVIMAHSVYQGEYEGLCLICFAYGRYGHRKEHCQWVYSNGSQRTESLVPEERLVATAPSMEKTVMASSMGKSVPKVEDQFGSWMIVGKSQKERHPGRRMQPTATTSQGNRPVNTCPAVEGRSVLRFKVLVGLDDDVGMERLQDHVEKSSGSRQAVEERREKGAGHEEAAGTSDRMSSLSRGTVQQLQWKEKLPKENKTAGKKGAIQLGRKRRRRPKG